jgi:hypothetical protein
MNHYLPPGATMVSTSDDLEPADPKRLPSVSALERVIAEGGKGPQASASRLLAIRKEREQHERDIETVAAELERLVAAQRLERQRAEQARHVRFPSTPEDPSDWLVIGLGLDTAHNSSGTPYSTEQEVDGKVYGFHPNQMIHWVSDGIASAWPGPRGRLPGSVFADAPADLLRVLQGRFTRPRSTTTQGITNPHYSEFEGNEAGVIAEASRIVCGCSHRPLLDTWLATARAAGDEANTKFAAMLSDRLQELKAKAA